MHAFFAFCESVWPPIAILSTQLSISKLAFSCESVWPGTRGNVGGAITCNRCTAGQSNATPEMVARNVAEVGVNIFWNLICVHIGPCVQALVCTGPKGAFTLQQSWVTYLSPFKMHNIFYSMGTNPYFFFPAFGVMVAYAPKQK